MNLRYFIILFFIISLPNFLLGANYYVAANGNDKNPGTLKKAANIMVPEEIGSSSRSTIQALVLSPEFGLKIQVNWVFRKEEEKEAKQFTILHGTSEEAPLQKVGVITASDYFGAETYQFLHHESRVGKNYYQIMVEYEDGSIVYLMWDDISFKATPIPLSVAPNPASNFLQIDATKYIGKKIKYSIFNAQGIVVSKGQQFDANHDKTLQIDLAKLHNGMYIIHLHADG